MLSSHLTYYRLKKICIIWQHDISLFGLWVKHCTEQLKVSTERASCTYLILVYLIMLVCQAIILEWWNCQRLRPVDYFGNISHFSSYTYVMELGLEVELKKLQKVTFLMDRWICNFICNQNFFFCAAEMTSIAYHRQPAKKAKSIKN